MLKFVISSILILNVAACEGRKQQKVELGKPDKAKNGQGTGNGSGSNDTWSGGRNGRGGSGNPNGSGLPDTATTTATDFTVKVTLDDGRTVDVTWDGKTCKGSGRWKVNCL